MSEDAYVLMLHSGEVKPLIEQPPGPITSLHEAFAGQDFSDIALLPDPRVRPGVVFYQITLRNAYISFIKDAEGVVITEDGRLVRETTYLTLEEPRSSLPRRLSEATRLNAPVLHATDAWFRNYYHWLVIALGKSLLADDHIGPEVFRVFPELIRYPKGHQLSYSDVVRRQTLDRFSARNPRMTLSPGLYQVPELHMLWTNHGNSEWHMVLEPFYEPFRAYTAELPQERPSKILVLRRKDPRMSRRDLEALTASALRHGYVPVHLEDMSLDEEATLFKRATHVIGPHGSGLSNIIFCQPGAKVLELNMDLDYQGALRPWIHLIADGAGLEYRYLNLSRGDIGLGRLDEALDRMA